MKEPFLAAVLALGASAWAEVTAPQPPVLQFPASVDMVNLNVSVLAGRDRFVTNLAASDFVVLENGIRQQPTVFAQEDLPISVSLMLDMSSSMKPSLDVVRLAASRFIDALRPQDEGEVIQFADRTTVLQGTTTDHDKLLAAVRATEVGGGTALHNALYVTLHDTASVSRKGELRRRAIVLLTDGEDTASMISDDRVLEAARAGEVSIFSILLGAVGATDPRAGQARYLLTSLARESGGQAFFPSSLSDLNRLYGAIAQELRSQYNIGYVSNNPTPDGTWRQILVMTPQHGELEVRHRLGYYAGSRSSFRRDKSSGAGPEYRRRAALPGTQP
jgi:VWFA-related protein